MIQEVFNRTEKKYLLSKDDAKQFLSEISEHIEPGEYFISKICNIYFDTENKELIRKSIEKTFYKEKIRARCYDIETEEPRIFLEIKKKFDGVVTKRRISLTRTQFNQYVNDGIIPKKNSQRFKEIDYCFKRYNLIPSVYIYYERYSYQGKEDKNIRITFDTNIKSRANNLNFESKNDGKNVIDNDKCLMELKLPNNMPMWLSNALTKYKIYPISFSKYGTVYKNALKDAK